MIPAVMKTLEQFFAPEFRSVLFKSLALTIGLLLVVWAGLEAIISSFTFAPYPWLDWAIAVLAGFGLFIGMAFLVIPISAIFAGLFLDEVAQAVEERYYPDDARGTELPVMQSILIALKFLGPLVLVNLVVLLLMLIPGVNIAAFVVGNGYLLGREYFELAALRHMPYGEARAFRRENRGAVFLAGMLLAAIAMVPVVNLFLPLFATAFMIHVFKHAQGPGRSGAIGLSVRRHDLE